MRMGHAMDDLLEQWNAEKIAQTEPDVEKIVNKLMSSTIHMCGKKESNEDEQSISAALLTNPRNLNLMLGWAR